jgi:hypothetical protein
VGFLKNVATLTRQGYEAQQRMDVGAQLAAAQTAMAQASAAIAASTPAAYDPVEEAQRLRAEATIVAARQLPMAIGMNVIVEIDLLVQLPGGVPLPVSRTEQLGPLRVGRVQPGARLEVSLVPARPDTVRIEWGD